MISRPKRKTKYAKWKAKDKREFQPYIDWLSQQPCVLCSSWPVEICHVGERAFGQKCSFAFCLPFCAQHHRLAKDSQERNAKSFWDMNGLNRDELITRYHTEFESRHAGSTESYYQFGI